MGAAKSHLSTLDRVQRSALHIFGPGILVQNLQVRRTVAALAYMYKLHSYHRASTAPPPATPIGNGRPTHSNRAQHTSQLPGRSTSDYVTWSHPFSLLAEWNTLPADLLPVHPQAKALQTFNKTVFHHLGNSPELGMVRLALTIPRTFLPLTFYCPILVCRPSLIYTPILHFSQLPYSTLLLSRPQS